MIVLTTGPAALARLMRRDEPSRPLAPGQAGDRGRQSDQVQARAHAQGDSAPPRL